MKTVSDNRSTSLTGFGSMDFLIPNMKRAFTLAKYTFLSFLSLLLSLFSLSRLYFESTREDLSTGHRTRELVLTGMD